MNESSTKKFAFVLGRENELGLAELRAVLKRFCFNPEYNRGGFDFDIFSVSRNIAFINIDNASEKMIADLINTLAGTTKIFEIIGERKKDLASQFVDYIENSDKDLSHKFDFGISTYTNLLNENATNVLGLKTKKVLKNKYSVRFVALSKSTELSTIVSSKQKLCSDGFEFGVFDDSVGILVAVTDPQDWSERDYEKPAGDKYSGMLPPKLARIMLNLALGESLKNPNSKILIPNKNQNDLTPKFDLRNSDLEVSQHDVLVVDPFCGSGNVVLEAMMLGCDVLGSDLSERAVQDSQENTEWLSQNLKVKGQKLNSKVQISKADATKDDLFNNTAIQQYSNIFVVTEPYLGEPKKFVPTMNATRGEYQKIKETYLNFLKNIAKLSYCHIVGGKNSNIAIQQYRNLILCMVFPLVETLEKRRFSLYREMVDEIEKIGYIKVQFPLIYGRDYQVVKREILLLTLKTQMDN